MQVLAFEGGCAKDADRPNTWHRARYALHVERGRGMSEQSARWKGGVSMNKTDKLAQIIQGSSRMVFFGGAGMSTESGIPDFRSADGIYSQSLSRAFRPEEMVSHTFLLQHPQAFFDFLFGNIVFVANPLKFKETSDETMNLSTTCLRSYLPTISPNMRAVSFCMASVSCV